MGNEFPSQFGFDVSEDGTLVKSQFTRITTRDDHFEKSERDVRAAIASADDRQEHNYVSAYSPRETKNYNARMAADVNRVNRHLHKENLKSGKNFYAEQEQHSRGNTVAGGREPHDVSRWDFEDRIDRNEGPMVERNKKDYPGQNAYHTHRFHTKRDSHFERKAEGHLTPEQKKASDRRMTTYKKSYAEELLDLAKAGAGDPRFTYKPEWRKENFKDSVNPDGSVTRHKIGGNTSQNQMITRRGNTSTAEGVLSSGEKLGAGSRFSYDPETGAATREDFDSKDETLSRRKASYDNQDEMMALSHELLDLAKTKMSGKVSRDMVVRQGIGDSIRNLEAERNVRSSDQGRETNYYDQYPNNKRPKFTEAKTQRTDTKESGRTDQYSEHEFPHGPHPDTGDQVHSIKYRQHPHVGAVSATSYDRAGTRIGKPRTANMNDQEAVMRLSHTEELLDLVKDGRDPRRPWIKHVDGMERG